MQDNPLTIIGRSQRNTPALIVTTPGLGESIGGASLKQQMQDKLIKHKHDIDIHGEDLPEIRNWKWNADAA